MATVWRDGKVATLDAKVVTSDANIATSGGIKVETSDDKVATFLQKERLSQQELRELMRWACKEWVSLEDIATKTGKDLKYFRNKVIP